MERKKKAKTTKALKEAKARYEKKALKVNFRINPDTEGDIFEQLKKQGNKTGYLKRLIREDLKKN